MSKISSFKTVELSRKDKNGLYYITVKSENLNARGDISIFIPQGFENSENLPMVSLLHGVYGSHWAWALKGNAHNTVQTLINKESIKPMALIMPSDGLWGDGSAYLNHGEVNFEKWITEDVPKVCMECFDCFSKNSIQFIAGLSMGGLGAMRLGAKHNQQYKAFSGLSAVTSIEQLLVFSEHKIPRNHLEHYEEDLFGTLSTFKDNLPPFRFDCGKGDSLYYFNHKLHKQLTELEIPHIFETNDGEHSWEYWEEHLAETLKFFSDKLN